MKKQLIIFGIIVLFISVGLSGCEQQNTNAIDSDGDGYPDSQDAFPTDANLSEKYSLYLSLNITLDQPNASGSKQFFVESDWKYVEIEWSVIDLYNCTFSDEDLENMFINIFSPTDQFRYNYIEWDEQTNYYDTERFNITTENLGNWTVSFENPPIYCGAYTYYSIYLLK
jgi:hypothetical protein